MCFADRTVGPPGTTATPRESSIATLRIDLLETLYLTWRIPAWSTNLAQRVTARPKIVVLDSGLAAHQVNISPERMHPTRQPEPAGGLLEPLPSGAIVVERNPGRRADHAVNGNSDRGLEVADRLLGACTEAAVGVE